MIFWRDLRWKERPLGPLLGFRRGQSERRGPAERKVARTRKGAGAREREREQARTAMRSGGVGCEEGCWGCSSSHQGRVGQSGDKRVTR
jgi:hypothetical protein